jgi:protein-tyrosine-phosphatase
MVRSDRSKERTNRLHYLGETIMLTPFPHIASNHARLVKIIAAMLLLTTVFTATLASADTRNDMPATVVFVCLHGSVKSQMAAAYFNRIAKVRGLQVVAVSRGIAVDSAIPASIRRGLASDGLVPADETPRGLTAEDASGAIKVFAFDDVPGERKGTAEIIYWSDVPPATKDYNSARDAIVRHIEDVMNSLAKK